MKTEPRSARRRRPRGVTAVEVAFTLPVLLTMVFVLMEYSRIQLVTNLLNSACRTAARRAATDGMSVSQVQATVQQLASRVGDTSNLNVMVKNAAAFDTGGTLPASMQDYTSLPNLDMQTVQTRQLFLVRAEIPYNDIALIPFSVLNGATVTAQSFMRYE